MDMSTRELKALEEGVAVSPTSKTSSRNRRLPRSRSTMFSGIARYYSNIFSSDSSMVQNRRTSVIKGGWLANPDLELLSPPTSNEPTFPHNDHSFKQHLHDLEHELEETVRKDVEYVEAEANKLSRQLREDVEYVEEEAEKLEKELHDDVEMVEEQAERLEQRIFHDVEHIEEEAGKLMHHGHHHHGDKAVFGNDLFRKKSIFKTDIAHPQLKRDSTITMDPLDSARQDTLPGNTSTGHMDVFDGTAEPKMPPKTPSKAEVFSDLYKECLKRSESNASKPHALDKPALSGDDNTAMPPPALKPVKPRSPQLPNQINPRSSIKRFPSVTVVDDRKGHSRSVSLISVKFGANAGIYRSSTNDLLELLQEREREERERLLSGSEGNRGTL
ncbi:hypothetical protein KC316_g6894 [Hortaea werneckii]|nr:hypothetical protein KC324_g5780 [Hortaea werneckii]KAI7584095.1 hypothetical protein KC316_g6894 [Hortaea werneckii]